MNKWESLKISIEEKLEWIDKKEETPIKTDEVQTATVTNRFTNSMLFMLSLFAIFILIFKGI